MLTATTKTIVVSLIIAFLKKLTFRMKSDEKFIQVFVEIYYKV